MSDSTKPAQLALNVVNELLAQKAFIADELRDHYDEEAKARQGARTDLKPDIQIKLPESKPSSDARDQAGKQVGVSGAYVDMAIL